MPPQAPAPGAVAGGEQPRRMQFTGLHHALICSDMLRTVEFYRDLLGMTLIKETVNADDPDSRRFYFFDPHGTPGAVLTFMEYRSGARARRSRLDPPLRLTRRLTPTSRKLTTHLNAHGVQCHRGARPQVLHVDLLPRPRRPHH